MQNTASSVEAKILNPSNNDITLNTFTLGNEIEIAVSANALYGTIEQILLFVDGELLDLPIVFPQEDDLLGQFSRDGIYGFIWQPNRPGTYDTTAMDDSGRVSKINELSTATVVVNPETIGLPVVRMTEPVPVVLAILSRITPMGLSYLLTRRFMIPMVTWSM